MNKKRRLPLYGLTYLCSLWLPLAAKRLLTGTVGPTSTFYATCLFSPLAFLLLGIYLGKKTLLLHLGILVLFFGWAWAVYPAQPTMDFGRQIAYWMQSNVVLIYLLGAVGNWLFTRYASQLR